MDKMKIDNRTRVYIVQPRYKVPEEEMAQVRMSIIDTINYGRSLEDQYIVINDLLGYGKKDDPKERFLAISESLEEIAEADFVIFAPSWYSDYECCVIHGLCSDLIKDKVVDFEEVYL